MYEFYIRCQKKGLSWAVVGGGEGMAGSGSGGGVGGWRCRRRHNGQHLLIKSSQVARLSVLKSYYLLVLGHLVAATPEGAKGQVDRAERGRYSAAPGCLVSNAC